MQRLRGQGESGFKFPFANRTVCKLILVWGLITSTLTSCAGQPQRVTLSSRIAQRQHYKNLIKLNNSIDRCCYLTDRSQSLHRIDAANFDFGHAFSAT